MRINPHELSIDDGEFYNTLYVAGSVRRTENYHEFVKGLNFEGKTLFLPRLISTLTV